MGKSVARVTKPDAVPPLRDGDRMTAAEFWRRYEASPHVRRAELIRGVVHIISEGPVNGKGSSVPPISLEGHSEPHIDISHWLAHYALFTPGTRGGGPTSVRSPSDDSVPEPDAVLRILPECGGQSSTDGRGFMSGAPELAVEVSNTSAALDLGPKLQVYQADGVREYLVWRTRPRTVDWFRLNRAGRYVPIRPSADGVLQSVTFPGLWLNAAALAVDDRLAMFATLQEGLASPEHAAFVEKLARRAGRRPR